MLQTWHWRSPEFGLNPAEFFNCLEKQENCWSAKDQDIGNVSWSLVTLGLAIKNEALLQALWKRAIETDERELEAVLSRRYAHEGEREWSCRPRSLV